MYHDTIWALRIPASRTNHIQKLGAIFAKSEDESLRALLKVVIARLQDELEDPKVKRKSIRKACMTARTMSCSC